MLRRLHPDQPESFAFTEANRKWAEAQVTKYPEGRQASAVIPLLWRAQEQEGWLSRAAIEHVAEMLDMAYIRALEVATFYFMFQLAPVGSLAHVQVCGTTSCMICGAEDLIEVCRDRIAPHPHQRSADGRFSWEEVECLGACSNAPMVQIGKDYYEDLTPERFAEILDAFADGRVPVPGPQNGRYTSEPLGGLTSLTEYEKDRPEHNASVALALELGDTIRRIDGSEVPLTTPWHRSETTEEEIAAAADVRSPRPAEDVPVDETGIDKRQAPAEETGHPRPDATGNVPNVEAPAGTEDTGSADTARDRGSPPPAARRWQASKRLAGQAELSARKGAWRYGGGAAAPSGTPAAKAPTAPAPAAATGETARPQGLDAPREGGPDDLKKIKGVGPKLEKLLHSMGFYHFDQIAAWSAGEIAWVDANLEGFRGRVSRDNWVDQAKVLAAGGETDFSKRAKYE